MTDEEGNQDYCETMVQIQDNNNVCVGTNVAVVSGELKDKVGRRHHRQ